MEAFYYGPPGRRLFGCFHPPHPNARRACGVVICQPIGHELLKLHRSCRQLALRLARAGFPVLRFDLHGCGDSGGEPEEETLAGWRGDLERTLEEMPRRSRVSELSLAGLRIGGTLAVEVAAARGDVASLVLWDPVARGRAYLEELEDLHREMLFTSHVLPGKSPMRARELLGYGFGETLLAELEGLDLLALDRRPAADVLLIQTNDRAGQEPLRAHLEALGARVRFERLPSPEFWCWVEDFGSVLVPQPVLGSVVAGLSQVHA